jgi:hypothetical protein
MHCTAYSTHYPMRFPGECAGYWLKLQCRSVKYDGQPIALDSKDSRNLNPNIGGFASAFQPMQNDAIITDMIRPEIRVLTAHSPRIVLS